MPHPWRAEPRNPAEERTRLGVRPRQIAGAQQELAGDLAAGEDERLAEQRHPLVLAARMMRVQPGAERAVRGPQGAHATRVLDGRVDLQAIADDSLVAQQRLGAHAAHAIDVEVAERGAEGLTLFQDRQPRKARLVDLEHEALEEAVVIGDRKAVLAIVIRPVPGMPGRDLAIAAHASLRSAGAATQSSSAAAAASTTTPLTIRSGR